MNKDFLFVGIPKTGCVSVQKTDIVQPENWQNHNLAKEIKNLTDFFSFCFIRNPYEKVLSSFYFFLDRNQTGHYKTFESFIMDYDISKTLSHNEGNMSPSRHFKFTQHDFIMIDDKISVNYIGDFNDIENEFIKIQRLNGIEDDNLKRLPHLNKSSHGYWKDYYNDKLAEIVYNYWKKDFECFNFNKNSYKKVINGI